MECGFLLEHLVILICVCINFCGSSDDSCRNVEYVKPKLDWAERMIKSAKDEFSNNLEISLPQDCQDLLERGENTSGVYSVWPTNRIIVESISVYCDMKTDGGGWTVIQRRGDFNREQNYFYKDWNAYKKGFGNLTEDFWLGNDYIFALTNQGLYSIRFDLINFEGEEKYVVYDKFWINDENSNYTLHVSSYSGNTVDSFSHHNGMQFTTKDRDNDEHTTINCAKEWTSAWWFTATCANVDLNAPYYKEKPSKWKGLIWQIEDGNWDYLTATEMKIRKTPSWIK